MPSSKARTLPRGCSPLQLPPRSTTRAWRDGSALSSYAPNFPTIPPMICAIRPRSVTTRTRFLAATSDSLIGWSRRVRLLTQDRRNRLRSLLGCLRSPRNFWSRGRELNPRPTDYEAEGRLLAGPQRFCSLRRNCSLRFDVHVLLSRDTGAFSRQARTRDHIVSRVV